MRERIPDSTFDQADQVELVVIEPAELLERLASGNVYREDQRSGQQLISSRWKSHRIAGIALRRCADRVNLLTESARVQSRGDYHTDERILAVFPRRHPTQKSFGQLQGWQEPFGEHLPLFMWKRQIQRR